MKDSDNKPKNNRYINSVDWNKWPKDDDDADAEDADTETYEDAWGVGFDDEYIYRCENNKFFTEYASIDCFCIGSILVIAQLKDWGAGIVLHVNGPQSRCQVYWQNLNVAKWHNSFTLLRFLKQEHKKETTRSYILSIPSK